MKDNDFHLSQISKILGCFYHILIIGSKYYSNSIIVAHLLYEGIFKQEIQSEKIDFLVKFRVILELLAV